MKSGFGWVRIGSETWDHDIIIHTGGEVSRRKKKASKAMKGEYGHTPLSEAELDFLQDEKPDRVFIGTGTYGSLPLTPGARRMLEDYATDILPTPDVLPLIEEEKSPFVAILHVTC